MNATPPFRPLPWQPSFEQVQDDEAEAIAQLEDIFVGMARTVAEHGGHALRAVHAKGQGLLRGQLVVADGLPPELAQGIFATPGTYDVLLRFSSPPAEQLPDAVSTPRAVALKVLGVPGERVDGAPGPATQDFLMVNGPAFVRPGPQGFVADSKLLAATTDRMPRGKKLISAALRGTAATLEAVGAPATKLRGLGGEPQRHPLGETYYSQVPFLHGAYMAKYSLAPHSPVLVALHGRHLDTEGDDAQRDAIQGFFAQPGREAVAWELRAQLCTDLATMPIEDASVEWPESDSPYVTVARVVVPPQASWEGDATQRLEDTLTFDPWHAVAAHRPLGAVNRARRVVMAASRRFRSGFNGCPLHDPPRG